MVKGFETGFSKLFKEIDYGVLWRKLTGDHQSRKKQCLRLKLFLDVGIYI